jgi:hypothetical protein
LAWADIEHAEIYAAPVRYDTTMASSHQHPKLPTIQD